MPSSSALVITRPVSRALAEGQVMIAPGRCPAPKSMIGPVFLALLATPVAPAADVYFEQSTVVLDLERLRARAQMDLSLAGDLMGAGEDARVRTTALRESKTIAGHVCRGFRISGASAVLDLYVATDLPIGVSAFADFLEWSGATQSLAGFVEELRKLPGFPLETRSRVTVLGDVQETLSTVTRLKVGPTERRLFEPPPGYRLEPETEEAP